MAVKPYPRYDGTSIDVNLGCADCPFWPKGTPRAVNVDIIATGNEDVRADATRLPFRDGVVGRLFAHHILEHLRRETVRDVLSEWGRVMRVNGLLSIVVPDWRALFGLGDATFRDKILFGHDDTRGPYQPHQSAWTPTEIVEALGSTGWFFGMRIQWEWTYTPLVAQVGWQGCVTARAGGYPHTALTANRRRWLQRAGYGS